jgi:hypothetical protein
VSLQGGRLANDVRDEYCSLVGTRNPFEARHVESRRGGPAKRPLSRDAIVKEALRELTSEGLAGMSLRKVARQQPPLERTVRGCILTTNGGLKRFTRHEQARSFPAERAGFVAIERAEGE